jgi:uncharacterized protein
MHDQQEGLTSHGTIETGARRDRVPALFEPVLTTVVTAVRAADRDASLYLYGSVATGEAQVVTSDVDLLTVGLPPADAAAIGREMSVEFSDLCRAVEVAAAQPSDFEGETDEAYGGRVFLRHYCVHLGGPDLHSALPEFPADARAARGFNGDIAQQAQRWRSEVNDGSDPADVGRRLARKSLLAVAGLVSVHDATWTTDRTNAASRWAELEPELAGDLTTLHAWACGHAAPDRAAVEAALDGVVEEIVASFEASIGLWDSESGTSPES